eukprot:scaffold15373_cov36-Phaeocystis_antarctica.AAC.1
MRSRAIEQTLDSCVPPSNGASGVSALTSAQHGAAAEQSCFSSTPSGTLSTHRVTPPAVSSSFWPSSTACRSSVLGAGAFASGSIDRISTPGSIAGWRCRELHRESRALRVAPRAPGVRGAFPRRVEVMLAPRVHGAGSPARDLVPFTQEVRR